MKAGCLSKLECLCDQVQWLLLEYCYIVIYPHVHMYRRNLMNSTRNSANIDSVRFLEIHTTHYTRKEQELAEKKWICTELLINFPVWASL